MLELGLATSHAPTMFSPVESWDQIHQRLIRNVPPPPAFADETPDLQERYRQRIDGAFDTLRDVLFEHRPDAIVIIGDDQNEVFGPTIIPNLAIFVGEQTDGTISISLRGEDPKENHITLKTHVELAQALAAELTARGFNPGVVRELRASARPEVGLGHAFTRPVHRLGVDDAGIPVVIVFINAYHPPLPTGEHLYELGRAIGEIVDARPERVALLASGGLSHDPGGLRAGWIDQKLDRWVLETISRGQPERLKTLFSFESELFDGGTGEIRSWIAVAAAFGSTRATVVDYVPVIRSVTGLGFAYWSK